MGSHLQLYASKNVTLADARLWCELKTVDIIRSPSAAEEPRAGRIQAEMTVLERTHSPDHVECWCGALQAFTFLNCEAHICTDDLVEKAVRHGDEYQDSQIRHNPNSDYAKHDWGNDIAVRFLRDHIGYVVWGYNDGV